MKHTLPTLILLFLTATAVAQPTNERGWYERSDIQEVEIGWMKPVKFTSPAKPIIQNGWNYPVRQVEVARQLTTWLYQTYTPKGLLGEIKMSIYAPAPSEPVTSRSYNFNEAEKNNMNALPNTYGALAVMDALIVKTATQKFAPMYGNRATRIWNIMANNLSLISSQMVGLSSPDEYYCVMPKYSIDMKGEFDKDWIKAEAGYRDFLTSPNLKNYEHYLIPGKILGADAGFYTIIIKKDNQPLPLEQVTIAEFIARVEKQLPAMYKIELNNGSKDIDLMTKAKKGLGYFKDRYSDRLNEYVYLTSNTMIDLFDFVNAEPNKDFYWLRTAAVTQNSRGNYTTSFPLLRLKKGVKEALAASGPQWIVCRLDVSIDKSQAGEIHLMENFVSNFNYDHLYNYFFGKEKVITPYKPNGFRSQEQTDNARKPVEQSELAKKMAADRSVLYFDDFSSVPAGSTPFNWTTQRSQINGESVSVVEVNEVKGKWLKLKRYGFPNDMRLPLSGDFTISFDLLVRKGDVPWGTPGMKLELYSGTVPAGEPGNKVIDKGPSYRFSIDVSPGNMNQTTAAGWVMIGQNLPPSYGQCKMENYYSLPDFTGYKNINMVTMSIRRKGESVTVLCNDKKVYECEKTFPADLSFRNIRFYVNEKNVYHISNILIKR